MSRQHAATPPVRRRSSGLETRAQIVAAAERHFAERGFEAARLEDIAADVGIRRAAIFYHFGDKDELYAAVLDAVFAGGMAAMPTRGSAVERLEASLTGWIDYVAKRPNVARLILREAANAQPGAGWKPPVSVRNRCVPPPPPPAPPRRCCSVALSLRMKWADSGSGGSRGTDCPPGVLAGGRLAGL